MPVFLPLMGKTQVNEFHKAHPGRGPGHQAAPPAPLPAPRNPGKIIKAGNHADLRCPAVQSGGIVDVKIHGSPLIAGFLHHTVGLIHRLLRFRIEVELSPRKTPGHGRHHFPQLFFPEIIEDPSGHEHNALFRGKVNILKPGGIKERLGNALTALRIGDKALPVSNGIGQVKIVPADQAVIHPGEGGVQPGPDVDYDSPGMSLHISADGIVNLAGPHHIADAAELAENFSNAVKIIIAVLNNLDSLPVVENVGVFLTGGSPPPKRQEHGTLDTVGIQGGLIFHAGGLLSLVFCRVMLIRHLLKA
ncbi:hypothetical protein DSY0629 [Desulfitobacterium hafniense Y51]|uniref:Uncharacterized protein n=1 Tax=Desulfitobacterium hafniense (strain Y51) TaxID=138119 RepID=Q24ZX4_DESHY|nr:hypothetical protein DSY0629 [Desulfitobacterium hafniense Y51]